MVRMSENDSRGDDYGICQGGETVQVKDVMTRDVISVEPSLPLRDAAALLVAHRISGMPVVTDGAVVGVISKRDVLFKEQRPLEVDGWRARLIDPLIARKSSKRDARLVSEAMTAPAVTIGPGTRLAIAARRMLEEGVSRLPVVANVGSSSACSPAPTSCARSSGRIARSSRRSRRTLLGRQLLLEHHVVEARVIDGNVVLRGAAPGIEPEWLERLVRCVPGVVTVTTDGR